MKVGGWSGNSRVILILGWQQCRSICIGQRYHMKQYWKHDYQILSPRLSSYFACITVVVWLFHLYHLPFNPFYKTRGMALPMMIFSKSWGLTKKCYYCGFLLSALSSHRLCFCDWIYFFDPPIYFIIAFVRQEVCDNSSLRLKLRDKIQSLNYWNF